MCGYDPFWIYDMLLEQQYLEHFEEENEKDEKGKDEN